MLLPANVLSACSPLSRTGGFPTHAHEARQMTVTSRLVAQKGRRQQTGMGTSEKRFSSLAALPPALGYTPVCSMLPQSPVPSQPWLLPQQGQKQADSQREFISPVAFISQRQRRRDRLALWL